MTGIENLPIEIQNKMHEVSAQRDTEIREKYLNTQYLMCSPTTGDIKMLNEQEFLAAKSDDYFKNRVFIQIEVKGIIE